MLLDHTRYLHNYYDTDLYSRLALLYNHKNKSNSNENMYYHWI